MKKIRFYHMRTLLWTYLVWAVLNLFFALHYSGLTTSSSLKTIPYNWTLLNIAPFWGSIITLQKGDMDGFALFFPGIIAGFFVIAGLLINRSWARFLVIACMSVWFLVGHVALGGSV
jgi:hypothetical protein